jgi:methylamine--corrinoid protein Co-methyltransferase
MNEPKVMIDEFVNILNKAETGPMVDINEWDQVYIYQTIKDLVKKYDIQLDVKDPGVPSDDDLADRVFEAAMDLAVQSGVYCTDTQRQMVFTREELEQVLARVPEEVQIGEGSETRVIKKRMVDQEGHVTIGGGFWGVVVPEDLLVPMTMAYAQIEENDFLCTGALRTTYGKPIRAFSPWDTLACWQEMRATFEAVERAGRPGMTVSGPNTSASAIGTVTTVTHGCVRPSDYGSVAFMSELKVSYDDLIRACHYVQTNSFAHNFYNPIYGGYAGGAEGVAVAHVAGFILMKATLFGEAFNAGPSHAHMSTNTFPPLIPAQALAHQALSRNTNITCANFTRPNAGPGEKDLLYEIAAYQLATVTSGVEIATGVQTATGRHEAHCSPLEVRFLIRAARAAEKMTRKEADPIVKKLIALYKDEQKENKIGKAFPEVYDMESLEPTPEWQSVFDEVVEELDTLGLKI